MVKRKHADPQEAASAAEVAADHSAAKAAAAQAIAAVEGQAVEVEQDEDAPGKAAKKPRKDKVKWVLSCRAVCRSTRADAMRWTSTTVFISSLPYTTTTTDLITHFSFIGPVRAGFVVKDRVSRVLRPGVDMACSYNGGTAGLGYVQGRRVHYLCSQGGRGKGGRRTEQRGIWRFVEEDSSRMGRAEGA